MGMDFKEERQSTGGMEKEKVKWGGALGGQSTVGTMGKEN